MTLHQTHSPAAPRVLLAAALAATFLAAGGVRAEDIRPIQAVPIDLGAVSGVAYYTVAEDGFEVVATLSDGAGDPIRVRATLADAQEITLSVPGTVGQAGAEMAIARRGDTLTVAPSPARTN